ncbi:tripartite tricarboxylate transporter TctB family protein [Bradyrhizobium prioriisuperbiae]|uniref:tripartite tricarboxylate transporter TctB family protein n=1 Tax=Bradyrhizobium prioriisuperbiae TaxID=2854389 RepID=UPI0028E83B05|nr:tripartite tricarboxylate transporter TctB family protein [Bradyrhizobium prioritasuperba]
MSDISPGHSGGPSQRTMEIGVCVATAVFGAIVIIGSLKVGIGWGSEGPKSGFFPFCVGLMIILSSVMNLLQAWPSDRRSRFADWGQLRQVMSVLVPTAIYVVAIPYIGIYVASVALIGSFMRWLGHYRWPLTAAIAIGVPIAVYLMFEKFFLVPLPKGPLEEFLNL